MNLQMRRATYPILDGGQWIAVGGWQHDAANDHPPSTNLKL
jgi:hypothetical protein